MSERSERGDIIERDRIEIIVTRHARVEATATDVTERHVLLVAVTAPWDGPGHGRKTFISTRPHGELCEALRRFIRDARSFGAFDGDVTDLFTLGWRGI